MKSLISIHTPTRGATEHISEVFECISNFNPHSHEGSDPACHTISSYVRLFQSTLPRGERPYLPCVCSRGFLISIHTPTRGATRKSYTKVLSFKISIHTPTRGATTFFADIVTVFLFQSTLPRGERQL